MALHNACSYADLAMTTIDRRILDINNRPNNVLFPPDWSRFRNDCFSIWFKSVPSLLKFTEWLNSLSNSIKFTVKYSEVQLEVLDTLLFIVNSRIESKVYFKPTDGQIYLLPQSSHHKSLYHSIPFGVALQLRRICSRDDWLDEQPQEFNIFFNVDDIITTSPTKVLTKLKTLHVLMHFYLNLAQMIVCRIWCWLWTTTQMSETFLNLSGTICPSYMCLHV